MVNLDLLILEDSDNDFTKIHQVSIEVFNGKGKSINYNVHRAKTIVEATRLLQSNLSFVGAIVDLKLANEVADEGRGNELIGEIFERYRIPIFVYSKNLTLLEEDYKTSNNQFLKLYQKADKPFLDILNEIERLYSTGIIDILGKKGILDEFLNDIFWSHISENMQYWIDSPDKQSLARYILSHVYEKLEINESGDFEYYHTPEVYIKPPIRENIHTGDIFEIETEKYLVITPACDIEIKYTPQGKPFRKASKLSLLKLNEFDANIYCRNRKDKVERNKVKDILSNNLYRYQYLPPYLNEKGYILDFEEVLNLDLDVDTKLERIASISQIFLKNIISRFSQYYSRFGQPVFRNTEELIEKLIEP